MRFDAEQYKVVVHTDKVTGEIVQEAWHDPDTGELHRTGKPALIQYAEWEGTKRRRDQYFRQGVPHRDGDLPQTIDIEHVSGVAIHQVWCIADCKHRAGGKPAVIDIDHETGVVILEEYWEKGRRHRNGGPAIVHRDRQTGNVTSVWTFIHGEEIVDEGPEGPQFG